MKRGEEESGSGERIPMKKKSEKVKEEEEALLLLIDHRTREVERNTTRVLQYTLQLEKSEKLLEEAKARLSRLQECEHDVMSCRKSKGGGVLINKVEHNTTPPCRKSKGDGVLVKHWVAPIDIFSDSSEDSEMPCTNSLEDVKCEEPPVNNALLQMREEGSFQKKAGSRPQIILPPANLKPFKPQPVTGSVPPHTTTNNNNLESVCKNCRQISSDLKTVESQPKVKKRKLEPNEQKDLIALIGRSSEARTVHCQTGPFIFSQHKRRLRSLVLCPTNDQHFVTSALDGLVNLWQVHTSGSSANILSSTDCVTDKKRCPEDIAWHPRENSLFFVYSADGGDSQVAILDLNKEKERSSVNFLEDKPHVKGNINNIMFMPWDDTYFVTGGTDHAVVLWNEKDGESKWKPNALHRNLHSSAVMGVAGLQHKQIVISAGADKRISGFDVLAGKVDYRHQIDTKCMSILPNPFDWNLFMVQTGTPRRQLRLYDYRVGRTEIHAFGWEQEQSQSQSALINQAWSPDGLYITSGSADPEIHIFDIRYNAQKPAQSVKAHNKRVFKAVWHLTLPLLISISSDPNIGLHKIT